MNNETQNTQYDPQAVAMVRALKMQESNNNYKASPETKGNSLGGAYMYQAPTWKSYAKEILGDENAQFTPENQDKVTYGMVKKWKDSGLQPPDIAHKWNPGDPNYPTQVVDKLKNIVHSPQTQQSNKGGFAGSVAQIQNTQEENPTSSPQRGFLGSLVHGIAEPVLTTLARPIQAIAEMRGASSDTVDKFTKQVAGDWVAPTPKTTTDVLDDVQRAGETVLTGLGVSKAVEGYGALKGLLAARNTALGSSLIKNALLEQLGPGETLSSLTKPQTIQILESIAKETSMNNPKLISMAEQAIRELSPQVANTVKEGLIKRGFKFGLGIEGLNLLKSGADYLKNKVVDNAFQKQ